MAIAVTDAQDGLRRIRCLGILGEIDGYVDKNFGAKVVRFCEDGYAKSFPQSDDIQKALCLVVIGEVTVWRQDGERTYLAGDMFLSDFLVPHQLSGVPGVDGCDPMMFCVPVLPDAASSTKLHMKFLSPEMQGGSPSDDGGDVGQDVWSYILAHGDEGYGLKSHKKSILRSIYLKAIIDHGVCDKQLLGVSSNRDASCIALAQKACSGYQDPSNLRLSDKNCSVRTASDARRFRSLFGVSLKAYQQKIRLLHARRLLKTTKKSIREVSVTVGYGSRAQLQKDLHAAD